MRRRVRYQSAPCIDLRASSPPYRVHFDVGLPEGPRPAYERDDPWQRIIPGGRGFVAPAGGEHLLACTRHRNTTAAILAKVPPAPRRIFRVPGPSD
jgi:hypothetical protein